MKEVLFEGKAIQSYFSSNSLSELVDVISFMEAEIEYFQCSMVNMTERSELRVYKYWLRVLNLRYKEVQKRRQKTTMIATLKKQNKANDPIALLTKALREEIRSKKREKPEGSGRQTQINNAIKTAPFAIDKPKTYEQEIANLKHKFELDGDEANYNLWCYIMDQHYHFGLTIKEATEKAQSYFASPAHYQGPKLAAEIDLLSTTLADGSSVIKEDGTVMDMMEFFKYNSKLGDPIEGQEWPKEPGQYWCNTEKQQLEAIEAQYDLDHPEEVTERQRKYEEAQKQAQEETRIRNAEWEKAQAVRRKVDKLLADAKAKEEVKCLIPKKLDAQLVEEQSDNIV